MIRHIGKLKAIRDNAIAWQSLKHQTQDVSTWLWEKVQHQPILNDVQDYRQAPAQTELSVQLSKQLKNLIQICRTHDLLCIYAGCRHGE